MSEARAYFGGIPYGPDVKKLEKRFGTPSPGLITHEAIEEVLGVGRNDGRYRGIVISWRHRILREDNIASAAEPAVGIRILTEPERVDHAQRHLGLTTRRVLKQHRWALMIDASKLDDVARHKRDHVVRASALMAATATSAHRELQTAVKAPPQLPRANGPDGAGA